MLRLDLCSYHVVYRVDYMLLSQAHKLTRHHIQPSYYEKAIAYIEKYLKMGHKWRFQPLNMTFLPFF